MKLGKFIESDMRKVLGRRFIAVVLFFLLACGYFISYGISQYNHILKEKNNFLEFERVKYKQFFKPSIYGNYGLRLLFVPDPYMVFFDNGQVPEGMTAFIDGSERMKIYQPLKGKSGFVMISSSFMTFAGFILLFGSGVVTLYGFSGSKDHEWLKFLEGLMDRKTLFLYQFISKTFILLLYCLALALMSMILFIISGVPVNPGQVLLIFLGVFIMLFCFLLMGLSAGTLNHRFGRWSSMVIAWFVLAIVIPVFIYHFTYRRAGSITSTHKMEIKKQQAFWEYEGDSFDKEGVFSDSKKGTEKEKQMFLYFWGNGFKKAMGYEEGILNEMKDTASFFQTLSGFFPTTFFLSLGNEMSSLGFSNLLAFNAYTQEKKKEFIWYIAQNHIFSNKIVFPPFIKGNENIFQGHSRLPGNFSFGLATSVIWLMVFLCFYWVGFNRMLDHVPQTGTEGTNNELDQKDFKKNQTNVVITSDRGLYHRLLVKLRSQKSVFLSVPRPGHLPGELKVKGLLGFFSLAVSEVPAGLQQKTGKYIYSLEPDDQARVLLEITRSLSNKADIFLFENFLSDLSDECIEEFSEFLKSFKKGRTVVYFTRSILISTKIADYVHRFTKEKPSF